MPAAPLVERDGEVAVLRTALREAVAGRGGVALVTGPAGIGKTSLATVLAAEAAELDVPVLRGRAVPDEGSPALWPWWQALQGRPELLDLLDRQVESVRGTGQAVAQRMRDFERLLGALAGPPQLVVLEDLHWADELTVRLLRQAGGRAGLLVLATARDTEWPDEIRDLLTELSRDPATVAVRLRPWSAAGTARFVGEVAHPGWGPVLHRHCGGNPLYAGELLAALTDAGRASTAPPDDGWPLGVPTRLLDMVRARLAGLSDAARDLVAAAAVLGLEAPVAAVAAILGATEPGVQATRTAGLLRRHGDVLAFEHVLVRDACYDALEPSRRVALHREVAELIDAGAVAGESVTHWLRCAIDDESRAAALTACRAAAERARGAAALRHAADLLDAALRVYQGPSRPRIELVLDAADLDYAAGRSESALGRCAAAADLAERHGKPDLVARAALVVRGIVGPSDKAIMALCDRALAVLPGEDLGLRAQVLAQRALLMAEVFGHDHAGEPSREALRLAERSGDPVALADALRARQQAISGLDGVTERLRLATRLLELGDAAPPGSELWARLWRIDAALQLGTMTALDDELAHLGLLADRLDWPIAHWHLHHMRGVRAMLAGRFREAEECVDEALRWARQTEDATTILLDVPFRAEILQLLGRHEELIERIGASLEHPLPIVLAPAGAYLLDAGDTERAAWCLAQVRPMLAAQSRQDGRWLRIMWSSGELAAGLGDHETTAWCYRQLLPFAGFYAAAGSGTVVCLGSISRQLGVFATALGDTGAARRHLTEAIAMDERIGAIAYRTISEIALAELTGDARLAGQAEITARRLGLRPAATRAAAVRRNATTGRLTKREAQILGLLVAGRANRQIAEELVLSERTVESHVSNVLGKLGAHTRAEAVAWAHGHGY